METTPGKGHLAVWLTLADLDSPKLTDNQVKPDHKAPWPPILAGS